MSSDSWLNDRRGVRDRCRRHRADVERFATKRSTRCQRSMSAPSPRGVSLPSSPSTCSSHLFLIHPSRSPRLVHFPVTTAVPHPAL
eukprot:524056-Pyramimonas_sp.AAC.1